MVKADPTRDYYADLNVAPNSDAEEIKRQYRKLAKLYHPDRNPGRENEVIPKFQAIQTAHEILTDHEQRQKYDNDRKKRAWIQSSMSYGPARGHQRYPSATSAPRPPPPNTRPPPQSATRPTFTTSSTTYNQSTSASSSGANRFSRFPRQPPQTSAQADAEARATQYSAWRSFGAARTERTGGHNTSSRARAEEEPKPARSAWEATNNGHKPPPPSSGQAQKPGFGRSNTTRAPPRAWYNSTASGVEDPQSHSSTTYFAPYDEPQTSPRTAEFRRAPPPTARKPGLHHLSPHLNMEVPFSEGRPRVSTPYASNSGEKTFFTSDSLRRSASTRDNSQYPGSSTNIFASTQAASQPSSPGPPSRPRSASPHRQRSHSHAQAAAAAKARAPSVDHGTSNKQERNGTRGNAEFYMADSSSDDKSDDVLDDGAEPSRASSSASVKQRRKARPSPAWSKKRSQSHTDAEAQAKSSSSAEQRGKPAMYDNFSSHLDAWSRRWPFSPLKVDDDAAPVPAPPYWAIPSCIQPPQRRSSKFGRSWVRGKDAFSTMASGFSSSNSAATGVPLMSTTIPELDESGQDTVDGFLNPSLTYFFTPTSTAEGGSSYLSMANHAFEPSSFNESSQAEDLSGTRREGEFRSRSSDSLHVKFSTDAWKDKFTGETFAPPPSNGSVNGDRASSHPRRSQHGSHAHQRPTHSQPPSSLGDTQASSEPNSATAQVPPPPPYPPGQQQQQQAQGQASKVPVFPPPPSEVKFSAEEWSKTLRDSQWVYPNPPVVKSMSPVRGTSGSRTAKGAKLRPQSKSTTRPLSSSVPKPTIVLDESEERSNGRTSQGSGEASDGSAMDIDTEEPQPNGATPAQRPPRMVPIPPTRPDWRRQSRGPPGQQHSHPQPPPLTSHPTSPMATRSRPESGSGIDLSNLENVTPFAPSNTGIKDMRDLHTTLPFQSRPAASYHKPLYSQPQSRRGSHSGTSGVPTNNSSIAAAAAAASVTPGKSVSIPSPPRPPRTPELLTPALWRDYLHAVRAYMAEWNRFDSAVSAHFNRKQALLDSLLTSGKCEWLDPSPTLSSHSSSANLDNSNNATTTSPGVGAVNGTSGKGEMTSCERYLEGLRVDEAVREHWGVACEGHREFMARHLMVRERVAREGV